MKGSRAYGHGSRRAWRARGSRGTSARLVDVRATSGVGTPEHDAHRVEEVPEAIATGAVAAVYADIRRVLGVPFVALVFRVLASEPGRLEAIWADLGPNLGSDVAARAAKRLVVQPPANLGLRRGGHGPNLDSAAAVATLRAYHHTNALNLIGLAALLDGVEGPRAPGHAPSAQRPEETILPMADLSALPRRTVALLEEMSAPIAGPERPIVIPSLFRHFAHDHPDLEFIWTTIRAQVEAPDFSEGTAVTVRRARRLASSLPFRVRRVEDPESRRIAERFTRTIAAMLVVGSLVELALVGSKPSS